MPFWIYLREETTTEGMVLVSTKLNEDAGIIRETKSGNGNCVLTSNAKRRRVYVYGDVLSVNNYTKVRLKNARQLTQVGTEK